MMMCCVEVGWLYDYDWSRFALMKRYGGLVATGRSLAEGLWW